jgi:muramidase (phage lysozyme)
MGKDLTRDGARPFCCMLLALGLAAPLGLVACGAPSDDGSNDTASAFSGRRFGAGTTLRVTATRLNLRARGSDDVSSTIIAVLDRNDVVTVTATSGETGWVSVESKAGDEGWAAANYLVEVDDTPKDGATCDASRGQDIVNRYEKALHDTIAFAEGTQGIANDGYDVLFGYNTYHVTAPNCAEHPNRCMKFQNTCSTAAGRYQFLVGTWNSISNAKGWATFEPENQERGAEYLITSVRKATIPDDRPLTASEFTNVITKLSYEWASLPPGQYGQPMRALGELRKVYCAAAGC